MSLKENSRDYQFLAFVRVAGGRTVYAQIAATVDVVQAGRAVSVRTVLNQPLSWLLQHRGEVANAPPMSEIGRMAVATSGLGSALPGWDAYQDEIHNQIPAAVAEVAKVQDQARVSMTAAQLAAAKKYNRDNATRLRWGVRRGASRGYQSVDGTNVAQDVYGYQLLGKMTADGKLGPQTLAYMRDQISRGTNVGALFASNFDLNVQFRAPPPPPEVVAPLAPAPKQPLYSVAPGQTQMKVIVGAVNPNTGALQAVAPKASSSLATTIIGGLATAATIFGITRS